MNKETKTLVLAIMEYANAINAVRGDERVANDAHYALHAGLDAIGFPIGKERAKLLEEVK